MPTKYRWGELSVGEYIDVPAPSQVVVYTNLKHWRDALFGSGLYTPEYAPRYTVTFRARDRRATIRRLPDGPMKGHEPAPPIDHAARANEAEREWLWDWLDRRNMEIERLELAGLSRGMTPLDILERARKCDPAIAQQMADLDCGGYAPLPGLDADRIMAEPHNTRPLRRHDDRPDMPADKRLAYKLANHKDNLIQS